MVVTPKSLARLTYLKSEVLLNMKLQVTHDDIDDYGLMAALISASGWFEGQTGRRLFEETYTDQLHTPNDEHKLTVLNYPVTTLTTVKIWDRTGTTYDTETATNYTLRKERYIYYPGKGITTATWAGWLTGSVEGDEDSVKLTYTSGYNVVNWDGLNMWSVADVLHDDFSVPADLEHATAVKAALMIQDGRWDRGTLGVVSQSRLSETITVDKFDPKREPKVVTDAIENYRDYSKAF